MLYIAVFSIGHQLIAHQHIHLNVVICIFPAHFIKKGIVATKAVFSLTINVLRRSP